MSLVTGYQVYINGDSKQVGNTYIVGTTSGTTVAAGGGRFQATNLADAACLKSTNGNYYDCYQEVAFTNTGGCVAGGCNTRSYNVASITKPYAGSGTVREVQTACGTQGAVATNVSVGFVSATTASASTVLSRRTTGSGAIQKNGSGSFVWGNALPILKVSAAAKVGTNNCYLKVWSSGFGI